MPIRQTVAFVRRVSKLGKRKLFRHLASTNFMKGASGSGLIRS